MDISVTRARGNAAIAVLKLGGKLDGQNYQQLLNQVQELYNAGTRNFLLDLTDLTYISSAGLVALHSVALLVGDKSVPDPESGRSAYRAQGRSSEANMQEHVKLLNPRAQVTSVLDMVGFKSVFEIFTDLDQAVNSFS
jgi:anti-anti-sigma regulatory factor